MIFLGQVQQIVERSSYRKIVVAVECGYHVDCYTLRVADNGNNLDVGDKILFTGYTTTRAGLQQFRVESLKKRNFASCPVCEFPLTSDVCPMRHDMEAQKILWTMANSPQGSIPRLHQAVFRTRTLRFCGGGFAEPVDLFDVSSVEGQ